MLKRPSIAVLAAGTKGLSFLTDLAALHIPLVIATYEHPAPDEPMIEEFHAIASAIGSEVVVSRRPSLRDLNGAQLTFAAGWQFVLDPVPDGLVVLHDSLLPRYRGFAPTVSALIDGAEEIGVTAVLPTPRADDGAILSQSARPVTYPLQIADAFEQLRPCYLETALAVIEAWNGAVPKGTAQDESLATYGIWRDEHDFIIDWSWDAARVVRFIDAVGRPYEGARSSLDGQPVHIGQAQVVEDVTFVERHPGKVWRVGPTWAEVICGNGMVRVDQITNNAGEAVRISRLRTRFGPRA